MNLLIDAHALLWFLWDDSKLSANAKALIVDPNNRKSVSIATCWEIAIKAGLGKLKLAAPAGAFLSRELPKNNFDVLPVSLDHVGAVELLPFHHRDPFDRILVATAQVDKMSVVSSDIVFDAYGITRLW